VRKLLIVAYLILNIFGLFLFVPKQIVLADSCTATYSPTTLTETQPIKVTVQHANKKYAYNVWIKLQNSNGNNIIPNNGDGDISGPDDNQTRVYTFSSVKAGTYDLAVVEIQGTQTPDCLRTTIFVTSSGTTGTNSTGALCWSVVPGKGGGRNCYNTCESNNKSVGTYASKETCEQNISGQEGDSCTPSKLGSCISGTECRLTFGDNGICVSNSSASRDKTEVKCVRDVIHILNKDGTPKVDVPTCKDVYTGLGIAFATGPIDFISSLFRLLLGVSGGIAIILIIISGYRLMTSQGNPEQVQGAREMLTSAIVGLLFIIFSFVILQIIGVSILQIPNFK